MPGLRSEPPSFRSLVDSTGPPLELPNASRAALLLRLGDRLRRPDHERGRITDERCRFFLFPPTDARRPRLEPGRDVAGAYRATGCRRRLRARAWPHGRPNWRTS